MSSTMTYLEETQWLVNFSHSRCGILSTSVIRKAINRGLGGKSSVAVTWRTLLLPCTQVLSIKPQLTMPYVYMSASVCQLKCTLFFKVFIFTLTMNDLGHRPTENVQNSLYTTQRLAHLLCTWSSKLCFKD